MAGIGLLALAGVLLAVGADLFTDHASDLARRWHVQPIAIGVLLAGAEPEELATALTAVHRNRPEIAAGDVIGANVTMLTLVVGVAALLGALPLAAVRRYLSAAALASLAATAFVLDNAVSRVEGGVLVVAFVGFVLAVLAREHRVPSADADPDDGLRGGVFALAGLVLVVAGGLFAVDGAEAVSDAFALRDSVVGLTFVALATSSELFALLWASRRRGMSELALAAIAGSVAANATLTLGITALISAPLATGPVRASAVLATVVATLLVVASGSSRWPRRAVGVALLGTYAMSLLVLLR
jgi:cation:H+ antiporter